MLMSEDRSAEFSIFSKSRELGVEKDERAGKIVAGMIKEVSCESCFSETKWLGVPERVDMDCPKDDKS